MNSLLSSALLLQIAIVSISSIDSANNFHDVGGRKCRENFNQSGKRLCDQEVFKTACACTCDDDCRQLQTKVHDCCSDQGVASGCLDMCRYDVSFNELTCEGEKCANEVPTWISCAAAGRKNVDCCRAKNISEICYDLCEGRTSKDLWNGYTYLPCILRIQDILQCHQQGLQKPADGPMVNPGPKEPIPESVKWASKKYCSPI